MSRPLVVLSVLFLLATLLSGCTQDPEPAPTAPQPADDAEQGPSPVELPVEVPDTAEAPDWTPGDWWHWNVEPRDAEAYEATTAVARADDTTFHIGWGEIDAGLRSQFFHFIPSGEVGRDLRWEAHHEDVDWFAFPLEDGKTWTGSMWMREMAFTATTTEVTTPFGTSGGFSIQGASEDEGVRVEAEWATALGIFTVLRFYLFDERPWVTLTLLDLGHGRTEPVHLLHGHLDQATFTSLQHVAHSMAPPPFRQEVQVPDGTTHVSIGCYLGGGAGRYTFGLSSHAEDRVYGCDRTNTNDEWFGLQLDWGSIVPGTATTSFLTAGTGSVFAEVFFLTDEVVTPV
ncbi:MAG: hypothetical protein KY455_13010 [Euryarchaeota archaeon]|nr:hypothetical protein [Euryarchaeota archaeon]